MVMKYLLIAAALGIAGVCATADVASAREVIRVSGYGYGTTVTVSRTHRHVYRVSVPTVVSDDGVVVYGGRHTVVVPTYVGGYYSGYGGSYSW
jgi:hypothetical protein